MGNSWGVGSWALGDAPRACLVCGRQWLCVGEVPVWWVWPPPWVLGVGLVLVLAAGGVVVRRCCCGTLLCFAMLYCVPCAVVCQRVSLCVSAGSGVLRCVVCYVACVLCVAAAATQAGPLPLSGPSSGNLQSAWIGLPTHGGAESEPLGPTFEACTRALFAGGGGCAWVKCPCGGCGPHPGRWVLG